MALKPASVTFRENDILVIKKILMVCHIFPPLFGGATVQSLRLGRALQLKGHQVSFLADNDNRGDVDEKYETFDLYRRGTWIEDQSSIAKKFVWAFRVLVFSFSHLDFKIFHIHSARGPELLLAPFFRLLGIKVLLKLTLAGSDDPLTFKNRKLLGISYSWCQKRVDMMVAISPSLVDRAIRAGVAPSKVRLVPNGVDLTLYQPADDLERQVLRAELKLSAADTVIVSIGTVEHRKGYDQLLCAFKLIQAEIPQARLLIVGPGNESSNEYFVELVSYIASEGITGVTFLGRRDDVHRILKAADLFAFCSRQEGFGTALVEAMACGLSVAAMDIEGITQWMLEGRPATRNCLSRRPEDFATDCLQLLRLRDAAVMQAQAESAASDFGIDAIALRYEEIYADL